MDDTEVFQFFSEAMHSLGPFEKAPHLAVAVSGGSDSLALILLLHHWASERGGSVTALTVDHGIRKDSAKEASLVKRWMKERGIAHVTLKNTAPVPSSNIQEYARTQRYKLLSDWCKAHHVLYLAVAHHQDDLEETLLYRLLRGSSPLGFATLEARSHREGICILRPLLGHRKSFWSDWLKRNQVPFIEDPSNQSPRFARTGLRAFSSDLHTHLPFSPNASATQHHALQLKEATLSRIYSLCADYVSIFPEGYATLYSDWLKDTPEYDAISLLSMLLTTLSGQNEPPRYEMLARARESLMESRKRFTLHGCSLEPLSDSQYLISRELSKTQDDIPVTKNTVVLWDQRFTCKIEGNTRKHLWVGAVSKAAASELRKQAIKQRKKMLPLHVLSTLPCLKISEGGGLDSIACIPHISYDGGVGKGITFSAVFTPQRHM